MEGEKNNYINGDVNIKIENPKGGGSKFLTVITVLGAMTIAALTLPAICNKGGDKNKKELKDKKDYANGVILQIGIGNKATINNIENNNIIDTNSEKDEKTKYFETFLINYKNSSINPDGK